MGERRTNTVGIDFGTSTTLIAERRGESTPRVLPIGESTSWMPSLLGVDGSGQLIAGEAAARLGPRKTVTSIKSALTNGLDEVETPSGTIDVREGVATLLRTAIQRAQAIDGQLFDDAEVFLGCPALWTGHERKLLVEVAHEVGLDVDIGQVVDEPVAAGLHWVNSQWLLSGSRPTGKSIIFDAGGGTLDVAYLDVAGFERPEMTVLSAEGRAESGDALDRSLFEFLSTSFPRDSDDELFRILLRNAARNLKEVLSFEEQASAPVGAPYDAVATMTRSELEHAFSAQLLRATSLVRSAVRGGLLRTQQPLSPSEIRQQPWDHVASEIAHVALVGGMSYVPAVAVAIRTLFPSAAVSLVDRPQESVVRGLVYGDSLDELNLPRPPVDFFVTYPELNGRIHEEWLAANGLIYEAFSPLYTTTQLMLGHSNLGFVGKIPNPPNTKGEFEFVISCAIPDRNRTPLPMRFRRPGNPESDLADGIKLRHDGRGEAIMKLYTNGNFVIRSKYNIVTGRIAKWPTLRGPHHDFAREIQLETGASSSNHYHRPFDDWRAK